MFKELVQTAAASTDAWSPQALAASLRVAALAFVLPAIVFLALGILIVRRAGGRGLALLWTAAMCLALVNSKFAFHQTTGPRADMLASIGGVRALYIVVGLIYGIPFGSCALTIWLTAGSKWRNWAQPTLGFLAWAVGVPLAILLGAVTEGLWGK